MKVFIDHKAFPEEVTGITHKRSYLNGRKPFGWEFKIYYKYKGVRATLPVRAISAYISGDCFYLFTTKEIRWLLSEEGIGADKLIQNVGI